MKEEGLVERHSVMATVRHNSHAAQVYKIKKAR